jgi:hypothetical protein
VLISILIFLFAEIVFGEIALAFRPGYNNPTPLAPLSRERDWRSGQALFNPELKHGAIIKIYFRNEHFQR